MTTTGDPGKLANLLIAGVGKAGTSSLFAYLAQHPDICGASVKETDYFAPLRFEDARLAPLSTYARFFRHCGDAPWRMEATPAYFYGGARLTARIREDLGDPAIVISLRDPVERFASDFRYLHSRTLLPPDVDGREFLEQCLRQRAAGLDRTVRGRVYGSLSTGRYVDYLPDWYTTFSRVRVVFFEDLVADPRLVVRDLCRWLDVAAAPADGFDFGARNVAVAHRRRSVQRAAYAVNDVARPLLKRSPRLHEALRRVYAAVNRGQPAGRDDLDADTRTRLVDFYTPANRGLRAMLLERGHTRLPPWLSDA